MERPLDKEFDYFLANRQALLDQYEGHYVVIKNQHVIGVYDDELEAVEHTSKDHQPGTFLVQFISGDETSFRQVFHSMVSFPA
jgi:hypothetical protein